MAGRVFLISPPRLGSKFTQYTSPRSIDVANQRLRPLLGFRLPGPVSSHQTVPLRQSCLLCLAGFMRRSQNRLAKLVGNNEPCRVSTCLGQTFAASLIPIPAYAHGRRVTPLQARNGPASIHRSRVINHFHGLDHVFGGKNRLGVVIHDGSPLGPSFHTYIRTSTSVPQRLPRLQRKRNPLLRLPFPAER